jgi:hypothetical protein
MDMIIAKILAQISYICQFSDTLAIEFALKESGSVQVFVTPIFASKEKSTIEALLERYPDKLNIYISDDIPNYNCIVIDNKHIIYSQEKKGLLIDEAKTGILSKFNINFETLKLKSKKIELSDLLRTKEVGGANQRSEDESIREILRRIEDLLHLIRKSEFDNFLDVIEAELIDFEKYQFETRWNFLVITIDLAAISLMFLLAYFDVISQAALGISGLAIVILNIILQYVKSKILLDKKTKEWNILGQKISLIGKEAESMREKVSEIVSNYKNDLKFSSDKEQQDSQEIKIVGG